jgi:metal-responsive CopG/Arc/MetJ family transcriptional regulator
MKTIRVVLSSSLLKAADSAAKRHKVNRSALIRQALEAHLQRLHDLDLEERDRRGYQAQPQRVEEYRPWEEAAVWPKPNTWQRRNPAARFG